MLEFLQSWLFSVVTAAVLVSVALAVTPAGSVKKVVQLASGLVMAVVLLMPFGKGVPELDFSLPEISEIENTAGNKLMKTIIEEETVAYIVNKAQALGLSVSARVICDDGEIYPAPAAVSIYSQDPEKARSLLEAVIEAELGISPARQHYTYEN